ncbi:F0F1 ATP synthase subunit B [Halotia wernerae UHCC 0503]|nr:F0F1 ATP synthase subunit B [Halotia wernerae UHCC 0503]
MLINWFTVIAQIINFVILVYLLYRFLYKPINKTMQERQKRIERRWQEAEQQREEVHKEASSYRQQQQELNEQREEIIAEAKATAEQQRQELVKTTRREVEQMQQGWREAIAREQDAFLETLQQQVTQQTYEIARRALKDLADTQLEQQAIAVFLNRLQQLDTEEKELLFASIRQSEQNIIIRSSFDIPQSQRQNIIDVLKAQNITNENNIQFLTTPDLICGIQLKAVNQEISWNFDNYLQNLEAHFSEVLKSEIP